MAKRSTQSSTDHPIVLSTTYCGPVDYFAIFAKSAVQEVWIEQMETYPKQTWRNRCTILTSQGPLNLVIPVKRPMGNHTKMHQIKINNESRWYVNHWRALTAAYNASPFFMYYKDQLIPFFKGDHDNLLEFNTSLTQLLLKLLKLDIIIKHTTYFTPAADEDDLRYAITPKKPSAHTYFPQYIQVFSESKQFIPNLSILDVLFNLGPEAATYLGGIK